jgi:hypothetical protein
LGFLPQDPSAPGFLQSSPYFELERHRLSLHIPAKEDRWFAKAQTTQSGNEW